MSSIRKYHYDSIEEVKDYYKNTIITNPKYNTTQFIFTAGDIAQFSDHLVTELDKVSMDTFKYIFFKIKKATLIQIGPDHFNILPFTNINFRNNWGNLISVPPELLHYNKDKNKWVANNGIIRFESKYIEKCSGMNIIADMFQTLYLRKFAGISDQPAANFFVNKRDFPILGKNNTEPYDHIFEDHIPLTTEKYDKYSLIFSPTTTKFHDDVLMPNFTDWCEVCKEESKYFPDYNYPGEVFELEFKDKIARAIFRGSSTGVFITPANNVRLRACELSVENPDLIDAGIVSKNTKYRKVRYQSELQKMSIKDEWIKNYMSEDEQLKYKYILILDGHSAAFRTSRYLKYDSILLIPESKFKAWIHQFMFPNYHYIPVARDLSDLCDIIKWCNKNERQCQLIIRQAKQLYEKIMNMDFILNDLNKHINGK